MKKVLVGLKGVPSIVTSDARTIRYPDPLIKVNDTVRVNIATGKIEEFVKFDSGKAIIEAAKRIINSDKVCHSYIVI